MTAINPPSITRLATDPREQLEQTENGQYSASSRFRIILLSAVTALIPRHLVRSRVKPRVRQGCGPFESASFPSNGPNTHISSVGNLSEPSGCLAEGLPCYNTRLGQLRSIMNDNQRRWPSCRPHTERIVSAFPIRRLCSTKQTGTDLKNCNTLSSIE